MPSHKDNPYDNTIFGTVDSSHLHDDWEEGRRARREGRPRTDNPDRDSVFVSRRECESSKAWDNGWKHG